MLKVIDPSLHQISFSKRGNADDSDDEESSRIKFKGVEPKIEIKRSNRFLARPVAKISTDVVDLLRRFHD